MVAAQWVCSSCGGGSVALNEARPSVDDRYAIGYCVSCCPLPVMDPNDHTKTKPLNRKTVQLVRSDVWDPAVLASRREQTRIHRLFNGKGHKTEADYQEMAELRRRWAAEAEARRLASS